MVKTWQGVANGILYSVQFSEVLDENEARRIAIRQVERPLGRLTAQQQYDALTDALRAEGRLVDSGITDRHSEASFRGFLVKVLEEMDRLRPWPEPPFDRLGLQEWERFADAVPIARLSLNMPDLQGKMRIPFGIPEGYDKSVSLLRLNSGDVIALVSDWWPGSEHTAVLAADNTGDPEEVVSKLIKAVPLDPDLVSLFVE